ncbi:MAG TPA: NUDIX domain-containing protein [Candidatus Babeliales bacterium]|nr:NUDIX domain-containing protein [Candidatus Babeliales bacterium]
MEQLAVRHAIGAIIFDEDQNFLILKRNPLRYQGWGFVKGGIDEGENALQALEREVMEEIGIPISLEKIIDMEYKTAYYDNTKDLVVLVSWFFVFVPRATKLTLGLEEWVDQRWATYDESWHKLTWQTQQMVLKKAQALFKSLRK